MQYKIIRATNTDIKNAELELTQEVNAHLEKGWELVGGVSVNLLVDAGRTICVFCQALTK
ncbi:DUF1737 domain-containing protein [Cupriavidus oxalaticus]|uniref:DUF1737 domain-containing protein n=1 Tax=Cupriavidus oxalaticus TaxID=96344 RepID=A0A4P7LH89_9BURK|nr:DUF1737 domain-containing protein [Cupriavidus oxalaticus]QBY55500.1 DUF1737 domain-containing protein [Cupriavidus oxalaticus]